MTGRRGAAVLLVSAVTLLTACSTAASEAEQQAALAAYESYWSVATSAYAAPGSKDWRADLEAVATGPALDAALEDITSSAALPAHVEGAISRTPTVEISTPERVHILDCVDLQDSLLVNDITGEVYDDLENRVQRYTFRAEVVGIDDQWLVEQVTPALDQPC